MNPPPPPTSPPLLPPLTAPNKTLLTSDKHSLRRPSLYQNNSSSPISPSSPPYLHQQQQQQQHQQHQQQSSPTTNEFVESFTSLGVISRSSSSTGKPLPILPTTSSVGPPPQAPTSSTTSINSSTTLPSSSSTAVSSYSTSSPPAPLKNPSHHFSAAHTIALKALCSPASLDVKDTTFWASLLNNRKFSSKHTLQDAFDLEMDTVGLSIELAINNPKTQNFNKLLLHLLSQLLLLKDSNTLCVSNPVHNSLFLTRVFLKHFVGNLTHIEIAEQFKGDCPLAKGDTTDLDPENLPILPQVIDDKRPKAEQLLDVLLTLIINMDSNANYSMYELYVELLNTLLVLFSTQLHHAKLEDSNYFLDLLLNQFGKRTNALLAKLLDNVIEQNPPPAQSSSVVYSAYSYFFAGRASAGDVDPLPVADRSLLLILLLSTQSRQYRKSIAELRDFNMLSSDQDTSEGKAHLIAFKELYNIFCQSLHIEERMVLFYLILVENESFRVYILSRTDPETLYIPILKMIYESIENQSTNFSQVYILMVILLIFSQDDVNNETIQKVMIHNLTWFTERPLLKSISLGGLTILVLIRTLQFNLSHQKDIYIHTNCLAILANMSSSILDMHAYVAQRLTGVFELIARRYQKWTAKVQEVGQQTLTHSAVDMAVYEDLLMLMLEIINATLTHRLKHNTQLVYALLLKRDIFIPFQHQSRFSQVASNVENVINYFHARVSEANLKSPSTTDVLDLIEQAARTWPTHRLQPMDDLKFQYEEEQHSNEFFVPYVWALIHRRTFIYWSDEKARILESYRMTNAQDTTTVGDSASTMNILASSSSSSSFTNTTKQLD